jgi:hypothetical protein
MLPFLKSRRPTPAVIDMSPPEPENTESDELVFEVLTDYIFKAIETKNKAEFTKGMKAFVEAAFEEFEEEPHEEYGHDGQ